MKFEGWHRLSQAVLRKAEPQVQPTLQTMLSNLISGEPSESVHRGDYHHLIFEVADLTSCSPKSMRRRGIAVSARFMSTSCTIAAGTSSRSLQTAPAAYFVAKAKPACFILSQICRKRAQMHCAGRDFGFRHCNLGQAALQCTRRMGTYHHRLHFSMRLCSIQASALLLLS